MSIYGVTAGTDSTGSTTTMTIAQGQVTNPVSTNYADGTQPVQSVGKSGEALNVDIHGTWYTANYRGDVFIGATAVAGTTIPIQATNLVSTFTLWNPAGSGKNVELIRYSLGITNATTVVGDVSLYYQSGVGSAVTAPGTLTALTIRSANLGASGVSAVSLYSAATLVNVVGTNMFRAITLTTFGAVTTTVAGPINYEFLGSILVPPGALVTVAGSAAQTQAMTQTLMWAEWST